MKWNYLLYSVISTILIFASCYDDEGNYDYMDIKKNEIKLSFQAGGVAKPYYGEPAVFEPKVTYMNKDVDTNIYKFEYHFGKYGCVCKERNMSHVFEGETGSIEGMCIVTDTTTGYQYVFDVWVNYQNPYKTGWVILSDEGGKSRLNMLRLRGEEYTTDIRLYQTLCGKELGTEPYRLVYNMKGMHYSESWELRVLQNGPEGSLALNASNFELLKTLETEFVGGDVPVGFKAENMGFADACGVAVGQDGSVYTRIYKNNKLNSSAFTNVPMKYGNQTVNCQYLLTDHPEKYLYDFIMYDKNRGCFMVLSGGSFWGAGQVSIVEGPASGAKGVPMPNDLGDYENLYSQLYAVNFNGVASVFSLLRNAEGQVFVYSFAGALMEDCQNLSMNEFKAASLLTDETVLHRLRNRAYLFMGKGQELYYYDLNTSKYYPYKVKGGFAAPITSIESDYSGGDLVLGVGLANGDFYLLDVSQEAFIAQTEMEPIHKTNVPGKVVDFFYKEY